MIKNPKCKIGSNTDFVTGIEKRNLIQFSPLSMFFSLGLKKTEMLTDLSKITELHSYQCLV